MDSTGRRFTCEFKIETVRPATSGDHSVAEDLDIHLHALCKGVRQHGENPREAFPGKENKPPRPKKSPGRSAKTGG